MRSRGLFVLAAAIIPRLVLAWGQPTHSVISADTLEKFGSSLPEVCRAADTRDVYLYASYSPDMYVLQGPEYVHLDRQFSLLLFKHAQTRRQLALAYGWSTHQEEDTVGHGRYIVETGIPHLFKELVMDCRLLKQGSRLERSTVSNMQSIFDAKQITAASADYVARYGTKYKPISEDMANVTGYVFVAYVTAIKGILQALWYGKVKWDSNLYPRRDWQGYMNEGFEQTQKWVQSPFSFGTSPQEMSQAKAFGLQFSMDSGLEVAAVSESPVAEDVSAPITLSNLKRSMDQYNKDWGGFRTKATMPTFVAPTSDAKLSHVLLQDPRFVKLGDRLLKGKAIQTVEQASGSTRSVSVKIKSKRRLLKEMAEYLGAGSPLTKSFQTLTRTPADDFFSQLKDLSERGSSQAEDEPE